MGARVAIEGKTVAVVGASRGLGLEFVRQFLAKGNQVIATARNPASPGLQGLRKEHPQLRIDRLDVTDPAAIKYVINNAGIAEWCTLENVTAESLIRVFKTNSVGPLLVAKELVLARLLGRGSTLANMTSKLYHLNWRLKRSRRAVTKSLSIDLKGDGVTCVLLHPGWVKTDMTGNSGLITPPQSVSGLISVLESDRPLNGRWYDYKGEEIPW